MALGKRQRAICKSIILAISRSDTDAVKRSIISRLWAFFSLFRIFLARFESQRFSELRKQTWSIDEDEYQESFRSGAKKEPLNAVGDLGFSGSVSSNHSLRGCLENQEAGRGLESCQTNHILQIRLTHTCQTFFTTSNSKFLIKSLPRRFEYSFFRDEMINPYFDYMAANPNSLLVRITDYLWAPHKSLGGVLGLIPEYHIVMENTLFGREVDEDKEKWETYDLKPVNYFYPERDILDGKLTSEATKNRLLDKFEDKMRISRNAYEDLKMTLKEDTNFLRKSNVVDYSLFLVRYPVTSNAPSLSGTTDEWREGAVSTDGWKYRAVILDFFWSKHKLQAQAMTGLINSYNVVGRQGPMSITTTPDDYEKEFLSMVDEIVEVSETAN